MRLRSQIILQSAFLVAVPLTIAAGLFHYIESRRLITADAAEQRVALDRFRRVAAESIINHDDFLVVHYVKGYQAAPEIAWAALLDEKGHLLFNNEALQKNTSLLGTVLNVPWARDAAAATSDVCVRQTQPRPALVCAAPVLRVGDRIGTAVLAFNEDFLIDRRSAALSSIEHRFLQIALCALAIGLILSIMLAWGVTRPLEGVSDGARSIGAGDFKKAIVVRGSDELRALASEFNKMAGRLAELDELKDSFIRNVSHELRNPLFAIKGYLQLMEEDAALSAANQERVAIMTQSCRRVLTIVNDILDLAKMEAGRMDYRLAPVDIGHAVSPVLASFKAWAAKAGVTLVQALPAQLPAVSADSARVQQVLTNLVSNALKFTPRGGTVTVLANCADGFVELCVRDTGPGIPSDKMDLLFHKFNQIPGSTRGKSVGTGLGLAISKEIVEAHGGKIWVESEPGCGSAFKFTLRVEGTVS